MTCRAEYGQTTPSSFMSDRANIMKSHQYALPRSVDIAGLSCRFCGTPLRHSFVDLGMSPLCESYVSPEDLNSMEAFYPLHAFVCENCFLVQLDTYVTAEQIFSDYAYFSSYSDSWLGHAKKYVSEMVDRFGFTSEHRVVEVASNDGYLLQYFVERGIPVVGIEPAANVAEVAIQKGIDTRVEFLGRETARAMRDEGLSADLLLGNNVLAHVPDLNSFVEGLKILLAPTGILTMEFPHLMQLIDQIQFDTIYHEHFCYLSLLSTERVFQYHGLRLFDVQELSTHGGSLRIFACHSDDESRQETDRLVELRQRETEAGFERLETYAAFGEQVEETKRALLEFLIDAKRQGKSIAGYGAPGKGNTLLNYCGIRTDFVDYTVDRNPHKQGKYLPGTRIPIHAPERIWETRPDYILVLPWNLLDEIRGQLEGIRDWGGKFVIPIPKLEVI